MEINEFIFHSATSEFTFVNCSSCGSLRRIKNSDINHDTGSIKNGSGLKCGFCGNVGYVIKESPDSQMCHQSSVMTIKQETYPPIFYDSITDPPSFSQPESQKLARCPKCTSVSITTKQKGFGVVKAGIGALVAGPIGLIAGGIGAGKVKNYCMNCGHEWQP